MTTNPTEAGEGLKAELLPCPFDQAPAEMRSWDWPYPRWQVRCSKCKATCGGRKATEAEAIAAWNQRRTDAQSIAPYVEALRDTLGCMENPLRSDFQIIADNARALLSGQQPAPGIDVERLPDDEAAALRIIDKAFRDAGLKRPFFGEAYEPGVVVKSIVEQVALHTPAPAEVRALARECDRAADRLSRSTIGGNPMIRDTMRTLRDARDAFRHTSTATDELVEALEPFAREADRYDPEEEDGLDEAWQTHPLIGDLRRARTILTKLREGKGR